MGDRAWLDTLGQALDAEGLAAAIALCRTRLQALPGDADAHRHLGQLLSASGEALHAQRATMRACELAPDDPRCWSDLGRVHARKGELALALPCFMESVEIDPRHADGWHDLGLALKQLGREAAAFAALKNALHVDPARSSTWIVLGELLLERGQDEDALGCFDRAAAHEPDLARARSRLGEHLLEAGRVRRAEGLFRQSLAIDAQHVEGWVGLGRALEDLGERADARTAYLEALRRRPGQGIALGNYVALLGGRDDLDADQARHWVRQAEAALASEQTPDEARAFVGHGLAKYHDARRNHAAAAGAARQANAARRRANGALDRAALQRRVDGLVNTCTRDFFAARRRFGVGSDQPVFIVGLPRSGTTLAEQVLAAHPRLHGAGELPTLARLALEAAPDTEGIWQSASRLDQPRSVAAAQHYLRRLREGVPRGRLRITDKAPLNFFHLGLTALLFPNARVIHCRRSLRDTALSIWMENFNSEQRYATDFDDLAFYAAQYQRLMAHWRAVLPLPVLELDYEAMVGGLEAQARRLLSFLDAPWDERCLDFHRSGRAVQTPSRWQVRQPVHGASVGRWRHYAGHLPELVAAFAGPLDEELSPS